MFFPSKERTPVIHTVEDSEATIRMALVADERERAAHAIVTMYGTEILGFMTAKLRSADDAQEAYGMFSEDLWRGLPGFAFRGTVRAWVYTIARNAVTRHALSKERRPLRNLPISQHEGAPALIASVRRSTAAHLRTDNKNRIRALRDRLSADDQTILMLYVDRGLSFGELAVVLGGAHLSATDLERAEVRLRKRFERIKHRLRDMAMAEGLLGS
jgi:RNA polymerase sigma-70 factor, ECF subfamily